MNRNLTKAKEAAKEFMQNFHPDREWWIVGGALRDADFGRPFKDIDIFINGRDTDLLPEGCEDLGDKNAYLLRAYTVKDYPYKGETFEVNLIFMRGDFWTLEKMTERCDFGICQIGWEPATDRTYMSDQFIEDRMNRRLTLCRETTQERVDRMARKFPFGWTLHNPKNIEVDGKKCWTYDADSGKLVIGYEKIKPRV